MSYLYVPGLGVSTSESDSLSLVPAPSATWNGTPISPRVWRRECRKGCFTPLLYTLTLSPSRRDLGVKSWIQSLLGPHASHSAEPPGVERSPSTSFLTSLGSSESAGLPSCSSKTSGGAKRGSSVSRSLSWTADTKFQSLSKCQPALWVRRITGNDYSFLPTPTAKANHLSPSMRKWPAYAALQSMFPGVTSPPPEFFEWMMGLPIGLTGCAPVGMQSLQSWLHGHGLHYWGEK